MKNFVFAVVVLLVLLVGSFFSERAITGVTDEMMRYCDKTETLALREDTEALKAHYATWEDYWDKKETAMTYFVDHAQLNAVTKAMTELKAALRGDVQTDILLANARVRSEAREMAEDQIFCLQNIF